MTWKDVLKSVSMRLGVQFVTTFGLQMMEMWPVGNLASHRLVCLLIITVYSTMLIINTMVSRCSNLL